MSSLDLIPHRSGWARAYRSLPSELRLFIWLACALTLASLLSALVLRTLGYGLPYSAPYYFVPKDLFADFLGFRPRFIHFGTARFFNDPRGEYVMYPAPLIFCIAFFFKSLHYFRLFVGFLTVTIAAALCALYLVVKRAGASRSASMLFTFTAAVTAYPLFFLLQRGNLEIVVWIPVTIGIYFFVTKKYTLAAIAFGCATSLKLYPFMFLSLLLIKRRLLDVVWGLLTAAGLTVVALWGLGPTTAAAWRWDSIQLQAFGKYFAASEWALGYDHSFFSLVKLATLPFHPDLTSFVRMYTIGAAVLGLVIFFGFLWRLPTTNQIIALSILSITIPPISYDYTLLSLYAPFALLCILAVRSGNAQMKVKALGPLFVLFAFVLTPESYILVHGMRLAGQFRCLCLIAMLAITLLSPLPELALAGGSRILHESRHARSAHQIAG